jgi:septal ring-binding cell division protein DamX
MDSDSKGTVKLQSRTEAQANAHLSVDRLLQKRVSAGVAWAKGVKEDAYTMQLMVLTDKNAEGNLKKMLEQPQYRQVAGNFFIFKKAAGSGIIFVFYGEYPNLAKARLAQNSLPSFLRDHQPYAISITGAMAKVTK